MSVSYRLVCNDCFHAFHEDDAASEWDQDSEDFSTLCPQCGSSALEDVEEIISEDDEDLDDGLDDDEDEYE